MGMDSLRAHHEQDMSSQETLESMLVCTKSATQVLDNKKPRPQDQQAQKCPRCDSSNTKFCYYNNYSLTQPRYFCKACRRYWTKGGTLRNVPVGGGCRKNNKRSSSSSSNSSASSKIRTIYQDHHLPQPPLMTANHNHNHSLLPYDSTDLSLAFARLQNGQLGFDHDHTNHISLLSNYANNDHGSFLDAIRYGNFLETQPINNGLQNVYYGTEDHHFENVGNMSHEEMGNLPYEDLMSGGGGGSSGATTTAVSVTTVKQERSNVGGDPTTEGRGMVLCGYPWQIGSGGGDHGGSNVGDVDATGRQSSWINGLGYSNWHGLINSPLM